MTTQPVSLARLTLLSGVAATHLTLLFRAGMVSFVIMASLSWFGGSVLLLEREENHQFPPLDQIPAHRFIPALLLLVWALLVLSFSARLYDPILHLVPLAVLAGLGLLIGAAWRSRLLAELVLISALLPSQVLLNRFLPTGFLAVATAQLSALLLWLLGMPAYAEGDRIILNDLAMHVDASCTGVNTLSLCLASTLLLAMLVPLPLRPRHRAFWMGILAPLALATTFLLNAVRVALLGLTSKEPTSEWYDHLTSFAFWHEGGGSHLFSLLAMGLVFVLYTFGLELSLQRTHRERP